MRDDGIVAHIKITNYNRSCTLYDEWPFVKNYRIWRNGYCGIGSIEHIMYPASIKMEYEETPPWNICFYYNEEAKKITSAVFFSYYIGVDFDNHVIEDMTPAFKSKRWEKYYAVRKKTENRKAKSIAKMLNERFKTNIYEESEIRCSCKESGITLCWKTISND